MSCDMNTPYAGAEEFILYIDNNVKLNNMAGRATNVFVIVIGCLSPPFLLFRLHRVAHIFYRLLYNTEDDLLKHLRDLYYTLCPPILVFDLNQFWGFPFKTRNLINYSSYPLKWICWNRHRICIIYSNCVPPMLDFDPDCMKIKRCILWNGKHSLISHYTKQHMHAVCHSLT